LEQNWTIINFSGGSHCLKFNMSYENPNLFSGWNELIVFHQLPKNVEILLGYYDNSTFSIISYNEIRNEEQIQKFHSRSLMPNKTIHFDMILNSKAVKKNYLVTLNTNKT
jgi:hypothetical protein